MAAIKPDVVGLDTDQPSSDDPDGILLSCSQVEAGSIQAIDKESVHRICSGQVVLTLATAVKELVENSIDAGATTVDIKLKEYGGENIEVTDNGSGVEEKNFAGLTQKHHTSKLSDFNDLIKVETFGFRGEALSSLCALSHMTITTRHRDVAVGTKLEYDGNGHIVSKTPLPRQQGTTVTMQNLFHTLPVRHREFQRNLKREFSKMVQVLNAYCLVNTGVRITCSNQTAKGSRSTVVSTNGNATVKDNISNIFGPKQLLSLLPFEQRSPSEDVCADYGIKSDVSQSNLFSIEGFVSKCEHGQGRNSTDRQFIFINKRPCDVSKIVKVTNEVYHSYNRHQYPFVVLLINMARDSVDVNVTPDKRQIFMEGEKILLATIKASLIRMFEPTTSVLRMNMIPYQSGTHRSVVDSPAADDSTRVLGQASLSSPEKCPAVPNDAKDAGLSSLARLKRSFSSAFDRTDRSSLSSPTLPQPDKQRKMETFLTKSQSMPARFSPEKGAITQFFSPTSTKSSLSSPTKTHSAPTSQNNEEGDVVYIDETDSSKASGRDSMRLSGCSEEAGKVDVCGSGTEECTRDIREVPEMSAKVVFHEMSSSRAVNCGLTEGGLSSKDVNAWEMKTMKSETGSCNAEEEETKTKVLESGTRDKSEQSHVNCISTASVFSNQRDSGFDDEEKDNLSETSRVEFELSSSQDTGQGSDRCSGADSYASSQETHSQQQQGADREGDCILMEKSSGDASEGSLGTTPVSLTVTKFDKGQCHERKESELRFSFQKLRECLTSPEMKSKKEQEEEFSRSFRAKISPTDNKSAEEELQREISKDMFPRMGILGQFNLGFIIAKNGEDLFIVDQHATDEKFNFEMLQRHTVLQSQQLIHPQCLELTASNEVILIDNLDIFKKNGFDFVIDERAPPTQRVKLKSTPVSKNWTFGKDDIEELIFMLTDSPGIMCRPSRVRMMFASRACRKSIMIGTHLNKSEMKKLLCHMGEIEQPWNCPHGRPTMRHLINLNMLPK